MGKQSKGQLATIVELDPDVTFPPVLLYTDSTPRVNREYRSQVRAVRPSSHLPPIASLTLKPSLSGRAIGGTMAVGEQCSMAVLDVLSITKSFEGVTVLRDVSLHTGEGEIVCLLGPSG